MAPYRLQLATVLFVGIAGAALAQSGAPVELDVYVEPSGSARALYLNAGNGEVSAAISGDKLTPITFTPGEVDDLPANITIEWDKDNSTSIPAFVFAPYAGRKLTIRVYRYNFTLNDSEAAAKLCFHTSPDDAGSAFRALFGCQEWVHLLETVEPKWTRAHLRGLRGWFGGAYYLFTHVTPIRGLGLSPWGLQQELVDRLRDVIKAIDEHKKPPSYFEPYLRIDDIRQALSEFDRWELKLYALIPELIRNNDVAGAKQINDRVLAAYDRYVGPLGTQAIDGVNRAGLEGNARLIDERLGHPST